MLTSFERITSESGDLNMVGPGTIEFSLGFLLFVIGYFITNANLTLKSGLPRLKASAEKYPAL